MAVHAPWPEWAVEALTARQARFDMHPYTCGYRSTHVGQNDVLVATPKGWECPSCDYRQTWAHDGDMTPHPASSGSVDTPQETT